MPENLEVTLWAKAPMFFNPTNIDIDAQGRVWVAEVVNYRFFRGKGGGRLHHEKGVRIIVLDDIGYEGWLIIESARGKGKSIEESYIQNQKYLRSLFSV